MDDKRLDRNLRSIGMDCFVSYYNLFADEMLSNAEIADIIFKERGYTFKACNSRTSHSRSIIRAGRSKDALEMVTASLYDIANYGTIFDLNGVTLSPPLRF